MKTKLFGFFLVLVASMGTMFASDIQVDGIWYNFNSTNKTAEVTYQGSAFYTYSNEYAGVVTIPASVTYSGTTYSVTSIGERAFYECTGLTSVTIGNSVTSIGYCAFSGCSSLTSVTIPNSVTSIGRNAFFDCDGLTTPVYNAHVFAFMPISYSGAYTILDGIESIAGAAFSHCTGLTNIEIPNSVISIGEEAFYGCRGLTSVDIPNSVTSIGNNAFDFIPNIVYHGNATGSPWGARNINGYVDGWLVYSDETKTNILACSAAAEGDIDLPNSVITIGDYAFNDCSGLISIEIPNSITSIGDYAFNGCSGLISIEIPNSITSIGEHAFSYCNGLISIDIPNTVTSIGNNAFYMVPNIVYHGVATGSPWGARSINGYVDGWLIYSDETKTNILACSAAAEGDIDLPNNVITIGNYAFYECKSLTSVNIPNSVTTIGDRAFYGCYKLTSIPLHDNITHIGGWVFYDSGLQTPNYNSHIFAFIPRGQTGSYSIPEGITTIADGVFDQCQLSSLTIPSSVMNMRKIGGPCQIRRIICKVVTPPQVDALLYGNSVLSVLGMEVFVPDESVQAYKNTDVWKLCNIYPLSELPQSIENTCIHYESHKILRDAQIFIIRDDKTYTLTGQVIE